MFLFISKLLSSELKYYFMLSLHLNKNTKMCPIQLKIEKKMKVNLGYL